MSAHWLMGTSRLGMRPFYVVDEHGCLLNSEPACVVPDRYGDWFAVWLLAQPCPYPDDISPLLEHRPAFPAPSGEAHLAQSFGSADFELDAERLATLRERVRTSAERLRASTGDDPDPAGLIAAALELERLLGHLRSCNACYDGEPCLDKHFLVKDVQNKTEAARKLAHQFLPPVGQPEGG